MDEKLTQYCMLVDGSLIKMWSLWIIGALTPWVHATPRDPLLSPSAGPIARDPSLSPSAGPIAQYPDDRSACDVSNIGCIVGNADLVAEFRVRTTQRPVYNADDWGALATERCVLEEPRAPLHHDTPAITPTLRRQTPDPSSFRPSAETLAGVDITGVLL